MITPPSYHLLALLTLLALPCLQLASHAQDPQTPSLSPAAPTPQWAVTTLAGREYISLPQIMGFFGLLPCPETTLPAHQKKFANDALSFIIDAHDPQTLQLSGRRIQLLAPLRYDASGTCYMAHDDIRYLLEPILHPHQISPRPVMKRIIIDPRHGGLLTGIGAKEKLEKSAWVLDVAHIFADGLRRAGFEVMLTRGADYYLSDHERIALANEQPDAIFLSLRLHSAGPHRRGVETAILAPLKETPREFDAFNAALGVSLHSHMLAQGVGVDGGLRRLYVSPMRALNCPSAQISLGYYTHQDDLTILQDPAQRTALIQGAIMGVINLSKALGAPTATQELTPKDTPDTPVEDLDAEDIDAEDIEAEDIEAEDIEAVEVD